MMHRTALVLLDARRNRHSLNALVGALETAADLTDVELHLPSGETQLHERLASLISAGRRAIVGVSFATPQIWQIAALLTRQSVQPNVVWIAGGPHPTADPEGTLQMGFQIVVRGEGEAVLLDLVRHLARDQDLENVAGIVYRDADGATHTTPAAAPIDLDRFPPFPLLRRRIVGPIEITRGCPYGCGYCQTSHLMGFRPRHRSVEMIARFARVISERGLRDVRFISPDAFAYGSPDGRQMNLPALEALLASVRAAIGSTGRLYFGTFPAEVRPEHVTPEALALVRRYASNDNLVIGGQSGSLRTLERCGRGHSVDAIRQSVIHARAAGLRPQVDMIFGLPGETRADLDETKEFLRELAGLGALIHAHTFMPLPQTRFALEAPGRVSGRLRPLVRELTHQGLLNGAWHWQEPAAERMAEYLRQEPPRAGQTRPS